jgi:hypothetical protein
METCQGAQSVKERGRGVGRRRRRRRRRRRSESQLFSLWLLWQWQWLEKWTNELTKDISIKLILKEEFNVRNPVLYKVLAKKGARRSVVGSGTMLTEVRGFDSRWGHWIFQLTWFFQTHYDPGFDSASNRNEYQESSWCKWLPACKIDNLCVICEPIV